MANREEKRSSSEAEIQKRSRKRLPPDFPTKKRCSWSVGVRYSDVAGGERRSRRALRRAGCELHGQTAAVVEGGMSETPAKTIKGETGDWEIVIGMEVHAQVLSKSKLFSGASTEFGAEPNEHVSFVDAGDMHLAQNLRRQ